MAAITPSATHDGVYNSHSIGFHGDALPRFKVGYVTLAATADDTDYCYIDFTETWGMTRILGIIGFTHSTTDSIIIEEAPTTTVDENVLAITVGGSTDNKKRFFTVYGI